MSSVIQTLKEARRQKYNNIKKNTPAGQDVSYLDQILMNEESLCDSISYKLSTLQNKSDLYSIETLALNYLHSDNISALATIIAERVDASNNIYNELKKAEQLAEVERLKRELEDKNKAIETSDTITKSQNLSESITSSSSNDKPVINPVKTDLDLINEFNENIDSSDFYQSTSDVVRSLNNSNNLHDLEELFFNKVSDSSKYVDDNFNKIMESCTNLLLVDSIPNK